MLSFVANRIAVFLAIFYVFFPGPLQSHAKNENYVWLNVESDHLSGRFEVHVLDLKTFLDIDVDSLHKERKAGAKLVEQQIQAYVSENFKITDNGKILPLQWQETDVFEEDQNYLQYKFKTADLPESEKIGIKNTLFLDKKHKNYNRLHQSLVVYEYNKVAGKEFGSEHSALVFKSNRTESELDLANPSTVLNWKEFLWQGVLHIIYGPDHVLFVIVLILTTVLGLQNRQWVPLQSFRPAFFNTLKIITLFTIAHSITLSLAALQIINVNTALVESVIAFSIIAVAINNLFPRYNTHAWILVFVFGLFHGLGFASVMGDLHFRTGFIERILLLFNVGVEIGQVAIVALVFPILFLFRKSTYYFKLVVAPISIIAIVIATIWLMQRVGIVGG